MHSLDGKDHKYGATIVIRNEINKASSNQDVTLYI